MEDSDSIWDLQSMRMNMLAKQVLGADRLALEEADLGREPTYRHEIVSVNKHLLRAKVEI